MQLVIASDAKIIDVHDMMVELKRAISPSSAENPDYELPADVEDVLTSADGIKMLANL